MASTKWQGFTAPRLSETTSSLAPLIAQSETALETIDQLLGIVKGGLSLLSALEVQNLSVFDRLVQAGVAALRNGIDSLVNDAGIYVLLVPVQNKVVLSPILGSAVQELASGSPKLDRAAEALNIQTKIGTGYWNTSPALRDQFLNGGTGGNAGFIRTFAESLSDPGDPNRPRSGGEGYVAGAYLVAGAQDYISILSFLMVFGSLAGRPRPRALLEIPDMPYPQDVRAQLVGEGVNGASVRVSWRVQDPATVRIPAKDVSATVKQYAIIRTQDPDANRRYSFQDIAGPRASTAKEGDVYRVGGEQYEVIAVGAHKGLQFRGGVFLDSNPQDGAWYYYVTYDLELTVLSTGVVKRQGFLTLSAPAAVSIDLKNPKLTSTARGIPPDWWRLRIHELIPVLGQILTEGTDFVDRLGAGVQASTGVIQSYIDFLDAEITSFFEAFQQVTTLLERLIEIADSIAVSGVHARAFAGKGGMDFVLSDMAQAFYDTSDPLRPPYDQGSEFVTGIVLLATAPTEDELAGVGKAFQAFFTGVGSAERTAIEQAIAEFADVLGVAEEQFNADLSDTPEEEDVAEPPDEDDPASASFGLTETGKPRVGQDDEGLFDCPPEQASDYIFDSDFSPLN